MSQDPPPLPPPYPITDGSASSMSAQLQSWVTLSACKSHLRLLAHFSALHKSYSSRSELDHFAFLCTAERRYTAWMRGLATAIGRDNHTLLIVSPPLPPMDVALFWAAHMLSPVRYMDDLHCVFPDVWQMHQIQFPFHALAAHVDHGRVHAESERFWAQYVSATEPYALSPDTIQRAFATRFICPYCKSERTVTDAAAYVRFRLNGHPLRCLSCLDPVSVMQTSTARLLDDLAAFRANPSTHRLPGCHFDPDSKSFLASANRNTLRAMFAASASEWDAVLATSTSTGEHAQATKRTMLSMDALLRPRVGAVARTHARVAGLRHPNVHSLLTRLVASYQNMPVGPWSMDLVQAVLRQRVFADKMAHEAVQDKAGDFCVRARDRYLKFMELIRDNPYLFVVPTLDIDLAWHTHQMMGAKYVEFTTRFTGKLVDHDDAVGKDKLRTGMHETGVVWFDTFKEPYACDAKYQRFWTSDRLVPALLCPPLEGPVQLYHSIKHKQAINDAGDCAAHSPSARHSTSHKQAYAAFTRKAAMHAPASHGAGREDPTKSSREVGLAPYLYFYSGCAAQDAVGFSVRSVDEALEGSV